MNADKLLAILDRAFRLNFCGRRLNANRRRRMKRHYQQFNRLVRKSMGAKNPIKKADWNIHKKT